MTSNNTSVAYWYKSSESGMSADAAMSINNRMMTMAATMGP